MKTCPNCQNQVNDDLAFCPNCGYNFSAAPNNVPVPAAPAMNFVPPYDHTAEFTAKDISDNKVIAMTIYLMGWLGILVALLASKESPYVAFHVRQGLKLCVIEVLTALLTAVLCWTCIVPIVGGIFLVMILVVDIICFISVCKGQAVEPPIIRNFGFLK